MANALPSPTCDSQKTPVIIILKDPRVSLHSQPVNILPWYINPLLSHLRGANQTPRPHHLALVIYGSVHCSGSPLSIIPFSPFDPHNKSIKLPTASHKMSESTSGTALDGYFAAIKMFDEFRATNQDSKEEFSYHLWHIAAGQDDESDPSYFSFSQTFWNLTWDAIPTELRSRKINLSAILLSPCPRYSDLFSVVSPQSIKPWFATCPHHTILLSGFEPPLIPKPEDATPSTVLSKRPADDSVEHPARRFKTEDSSPSINTPSPPHLAYTSPTISQAGVRATDSPIEPSPCEGQDMKNDLWSGTLSWSGEGSEVCASVQATDIVRDPHLSAWPQLLRLEIAGTKMRGLDFQAWIFKYRASVVRIQCIAGMGEQDFGELVKSLRDDACVAIARLEIGSSPNRGLVLAPLHGGLLCAAFLTSDIPELPNPPLEQQQQQKDPNADCTHAAEIPLAFENADYLQGDHCDNQTNVFIAEPLTQSTLPQQSQVCVQGPMSQSSPRVQGPVPQPQACTQGPQPQGCVQGPLPQQPVHVQGPLPQPHACVQGPLPQLAAYVQGPPPQPQAQQSSRSASIDTQHLLMGGLVPGNVELAASAESVDFLTDPWNLSALYDRHINAGWYDCGTPSNSWDDAGPAGILSLGQF